MNDTQRLLDKRLRAAGAILDARVDVDERTYATAAGYREEAVYSYRRGDEFKPLAKVTVTTKSHGAVFNFRLEPIAWGSAEEKSTHSPSGEGWLGSDLDAPVAAIEAWLKMRRRALAASR